MFFLFLDKYFEYCFFPWPDNLIKVSSLILFKINRLYLIFYVFSFYDSTTNVPLKI
jgi:hypothetical protein